MVQIHAGQLLVQSLEALGARHGFGVPGESYLAVLDGFYDSKKLKFTTCRNEGGASFMAAAYGKLTGQPGLCFVTRGPGATNASIGVHAAMQDSSPMILFVGQIDTRAKAREGFQEVDYRAFFSPLAKWATEIDEVARIPEILARAWTMATSGRPGPVVVSLPENKLSADASGIPPLNVAPSISEAGATQASLAAIQSAILDAGKPVILMGSAGWTTQGIRALESFAEASNLPVIVTFRNNDKYNNNLSSYVGEAGVGMMPHIRETLQNSDLILAIGTRFNEMSTAAFELFDIPKMRQTLVHIHPSPDELGKIYQPDIALAASPNEIAKALQPITGNWSNWQKAARAAYESATNLPAQPGPIDMGEVMKTLQATLPSDAILTNGAGNFTIWPNKFFRYGENHRLLASQSGAMGYGLPAAVMAKIVDPTRTVLCFAGDGDFQMNLPELGTAMQAGTGPIVLILNNGSYGTIRAHQDRHFPDRVSGTQLENPNFTQLAQSYGFHAEEVTTTKDFAPALQRAMRSKTGAILNLHVGMAALTASVR